MTPYNINNKSTLYLKRMIYIAICKRTVKQKTLIIKNFHLENKLIT